MIEVVAVAAVLTCDLPCMELGSEPEEMIKVQHHCLLHLRLVHQGDCVQGTRSLWVLVVVTLVPGLAPDVGVEQPAKPWFEAM